MSYIDANVFIFAACDSGKLGNASRALIKAIECGQQTASTSALTYDEVVWGVRKGLDKEKSFLVGELFLSLTHLLIKDVNRNTISEAQHLMKLHNLKPRDALHLATMRLEHESEIISEDPDFDVVPWVTRVSLSKVKIL